jgi:hypothetical protein
LKKREARDEQPTRLPARLFDRAALVTLAPLGIALLAVMAWAPWHSNYNVDTLTHFEQIRSVAQNGSLGFDNGPAEDLPELETRFFFVAHGRTWGAYPAGLAYLLAPAMRLGGYRGAIRALWFMLAVTAALTYALVWRATEKRGLAIASAYVLVLGTSLGVYATSTTPYIPCAMFLTASILALQCAADRSGSARYLSASLAGLFAAAAVSCHLIASPSWLAIGAVFLALHDATWRTRFTSGVAYALGSVPPMLLLAATNNLRYDTWNPIAYAKCGVAPWNPCDEVIERYQAASGLLASLRFVPFVLGVYLATRIVRRTRWGALGLAAVSFATLFTSEAAIESVGYGWRALWMLTVDSMWMDMAMTRGSHDIGSFPGTPHEMPFCVRAVIQCSPIVVAAGFAGARALRRTQVRPLVLGLAAITLGMIAMVVIRGSMGGADVYGFSTLNFRYLSPMLPALVALAFIATSELRWSGTHVAVAIAFATLGACLLSWSENDLPFARRVVTEIAPLVLASVIVLSLGALRFAPARFTAAAETTAPFAMALAAAYGIAITTGIDRMFVHTVRAAQDARVVELARCTPQRFLLVGGSAMDEAFALQDERDIHFVNAGMGEGDRSTVRRLVENAIRTGRPAFLIQDNPDGPWHFAWQDFRVAPIEGCPRIQRFVYVPRR